MADDKLQDMGEDSTPDSREYQRVWEQARAKKKQDELNERNQKQAEEQKHV